MNVKWRGVSLFDGGLFRVRGRRPLSGAVRKPSTLRSRRSMLHDANQLQSRCSSE